MNDFRNMTVLVTGATGLIGRHLTERLLHIGARVIAVGRDIRKLKMVLGNLSGESDLLCVEGNISANFPAVESEIDYVFHAASPISATQIRTNPVDTISANLDGARNCLEFLRKQGRGRMVVFSSATAYGNFRLHGDVTVSEEMTDRADALHTNNTPYSESKRMAEVLARAYGEQYGVDTLIARLGYVYGFAYPRPETAFYAFIENAVRGENIIIRNSGTGKRDNIYVDDAVSGLLMAALNGKSGEAYNISSNGELGNFAAVDEIAEMIAEQANRFQERKIQVIIQRTGDGRCPGMKMDNSKLKKLGWNLSVCLKEGIERTLRAYVPI